MISLRFTTMGSLLAALVISTTASAQGSFDFHQDIGVVALEQSGKPCLSIPAPNLKPGTKLAIVLISLEGSYIPPQRPVAEVLAPLDSLCDFPVFDRAYGVKLL